MRHDCNMRLPCGCCSSCGEHDYECMRKIVWAPNAFSLKPLSTNATTQRTPAPHIWSAPIPGRLHCSLVGGATYCEPRRWRPQRWSVCKLGMLHEWVESAPAYCGAKSEDIPFMLDRWGKLPSGEYGYWRDAGTCTPGAGPVCGVG